MTSQLHAFNLLQTIGQGRQSHEPPPCWFMRQSGRYLPSYQEVKKKYTFNEMASIPDLMAEVTLLPLEYFEPDSLIIFTDILVLLECMDYEYKIIKGEGPVVSPKFVLEKTLDPRSPFEALAYVAEGIKKVKSISDLPVLGFSGAPFTLASYLIEGGKTQNFVKIKRFLHEHPDEFAALLMRLADLVVDYLNMQLEAGACMVQVFDTWAEVLTLEQYQKFAIPALKLIAENVKGPCIYFCKSIERFYPLLSEVNFSGWAIDERSNLSLARQHLGPQKILQGNLDPALLFCDEKTIAKACSELLHKQADNPHYIFNLGHGVLPQVDWKKVRFICDFVKNWQG